ATLTSILRSRTRRGRSDERRTTKSRVRVEPKKPTASPVVTVYAVRRPDKQWALLAINKHPKHAAQLNVQFNIPGAQQPVRFVGQVEVIQFSQIGRASCRERV